VPPCDAFYDLDSPVERQLPEHPEWEVAIEVEQPQWALLTHRDTKEMIFVDVSEKGDGGVLHLEYWNARRRSDPIIDPATSRLLEMYPLPEGLDLPENWRTLPQSCQVLFDDFDAISELADSGLVEGREYGEFGPMTNDTLPDCYLPGDSLLEHEDLALAFLAHWNDPETQLWCSALIADWPKAHELAVEAGDEDLIRVTAPRAAECRRARIHQCLGLDGDRTLYRFWHPC
jgi:hypothetical protein